MRCILIANPGRHNQLLLTQQHIPSCKKDEVLVKVKTAGVNRADLLQRQGKYPVPDEESKIPGLEVAGEVVAKGTEVTKLQIGDLIYGLVGGGGYAEYCCVNQHTAALIYPGWNFTTAVALPEALVTAHATLFLLGQLQPGQTILMHGAGSGISSIALQMAKIHGAHIISTVSSEKKMLQAQQFEPATLINYKQVDFEHALEPNSIDLIVDFIGGDYFPKHLRLLKPCGKLIQIACMKGYLVETNLVLVMQKRLQIHGFVLRAQSILEKIQLWQSMQRQWSMSLQNKQILPIIDAEYSLEEVGQAHQRLLNNEHFGKVVLVIS